MSSNSAANSDRWEELQATRLLFGLSADEQVENDDLARQMPADSATQFDTVVAAIDVAWADAQQPLPEQLRRAIRSRAEQEIASKKVASPQVSPVGLGSRGRSVNYAPWLVAAASVALALFTWLANRPVQRTEPTIAQLRSELMASADDLLRADWSAGTTPIEGATGDVVWSSSRQQGYMRFRGLTVNEPTREQYQLWIFDKNQSDKTPIDGGVFDVAASDEVIVPINAKLRVQEALMFAITIEKPGGVVVSSRERLPLLAKVE